MKRILLSIALSAFSLSYSFAQARLVEKVVKKGNELVIPYEKYQLPNGLLVIVHEDHSDPIVHVDVTYHVGSAREEIGKSGFAHFFEHMMFQGSDNVADEQHFKIITEAGGTLNGSTNRDRTNYFETVPSNQLEKMLWLEADRMGFLLDAVTQQKFEVQRATVKNERGQRYDNVPYGLVSEVSAKNLYPYGHPYSWLTIGYVEDLNRVNVEDLKNFFLRWYGPNNAVLTVGGDVKAADVIKLAEKYFGSIPQCPKVNVMKPSIPVVEKDRYVSMKDGYAKLPQLRMVYPVPAMNSKDEPALDCLAEILGQGKNSIVYKNFVKSQKAVNANAYNSTTELSGEFVLSVTPFPGQKLADMEKMLRESLVEFEKRGVKDEDILKFRSQQEASMINGLESVSGKVSRLAAYQTFTGDANFIRKDLSRYTSLTKQDVMNAYNNYIKGKAAVILSVLTKGNDDNLAATDNYAVSTTDYKAPDYGYNGLKYVKAKDNFDRSKEPAAGTNPVVTVPAFWKETIAGDISAIGAKSDEIPVVTLLLKLKGGRLLDANNPDKMGLASLFSDMMDEDTKNLTAEQFSDELDKLGSSIDVRAGDDAIVVSVQCLKKNLKPTLSLLHERLLAPKFTEQALDRIKKRSIESIKNSMNRPNYVASTVYPKLLYGADNVLGFIGSGNEKTINAVSIKDIETYYLNNISRKDAQLIVVGDVDQKEIVSGLGFLSELPSKNVVLPTIPNNSEIKSTKIYFIDVAKAAQTEFRVGYVTNLKYDAMDDYFKTTVMNYPLGGAFNSRLNLDLREDKGWTYGARGSFDGDKYTGSYTFSAGIKADATDSALVDILSILKDYHDGGIKADELKFTQLSLGQSDARKYEAAMQKAGFLGRLLDYNLNGNYTKMQNDILAKLTVSDINLYAKRYAPDVSKMNILLVGDKAKCWEKLSRLGIEMVELDKEGNQMQK